MRTVRSLDDPLARHPLAREAVVSVAAVGALGLWISLVTEAVRRYVPVAALDAPGGANAELALTAFLTGLFVLAGMALFAGAFAFLRDMEVAPALPDRRVLGYGAWATVAGVALVGVVKLAGMATTGSLSAAAGITHAPDSAVAVVAMITALELFLGVPTYVLVTHLLVQRSVRRAGHPMAAAGITAVGVGAFGPTTVLSMDPAMATVGAGVLALAIAVPAVAAVTYDRRWLTALTTLPLVLLVAGLGFERIAAVPDVASLAYHAAEIGVVAVGAYAYERSGSMLPSALAYASFVVAAEALVFVAQVGVPP